MQRDPILSLIFDPLFLTFPLFEILLILWYFITFTLVKMAAPKLRILSKPTLLNRDSGQERKQTNLGGPWGELPGQSWIMAFLFQYLFLTYTEFYYGKSLQSWIFKTVKKVRQPHLFYWTPFILQKISCSFFLPNLGDLFPRLRQWNRNTNSWRVKALFSEKEEVIPKFVIVGSYC